MLTVTPSPYPSPSGVAVTAQTGGSPGFLGFVFTFLLAVAVVLLFLSLTKHLRIVDRRAKQQGLDDDGADTSGADATDDSTASAASAVDVPTPRSAPRADDDDPSAR
ncbi:MAG: hypothetical protein AAGC49_06165 [Brevundimonas sp.]